MCANAQAKEVKELTCVGGKANGRLARQATGDRSSFRIMAELSIHLPSTKEQDNYLSSAFSVAKEEMERLYEESIMRYSLQGRSGGRY